MDQKTYTHDSDATLAGGKRGFVIGALGGAALFGLVTLVMDMMQIGSGGAVMAAMGGAAVGGLAGTISGALMARRHVTAPERGYTGPDRRMRNAAYAGMDRRVH